MCKLDSVKSTGGESWILVSPLELYTYCMKYVALNMGYEGILKVKEFKRKEITLHRTGIPLFVGWRTGSHLHHHQAWGSQWRR